MRFRAINVSPAIPHVVRTVIGPALALLYAQGCIPAVMHGPRVHEGFTTGLAASYTAGPRATRSDNGGMAYAYGPVGLNVGYGWTSESTEGFGVLLGLHVPVPLVAAAQGDVYVQIPKRALLGFDGGAGVVLIPVLGASMPYAQLGALSSSGSGLYVTYGFLMGYDNASNSGNSRRGAGTDVPGIAFQNVNGQTTTRFFVTAAIARERCADGIADCQRPDDWSVASGVAVEFHPRKRH